MNEGSPPQRLLEDPTGSAQLRAELLAYQRQSAALPFDVGAQLQRLQAGLAATEGTAVATASNLATTSTGAAAQGVLGVGAGIWASAGALVLGGAALVWFNRLPSPPPRVQQDPATQPSPVPATEPGPETPHRQASDPALGIPTPSRHEQADPPGAEPAAIDPLAAELAAIAQAKAKLRDRDPRAALKILQRFEQTQHNGSLAPERQALTVIALARSGQKLKARKAARRFLAAHPESPMASRIRSVLK